jgi:hypothetical protein
MIGDDLTLYRFGLLLSGAFTIMIISTLAFERSSFLRDIKFTDWLTAAFTAALAVFTWALVNVARQQTTILDKTDQTLKAAQRPWVSVGPAQPVGDFEFIASGAALMVAFGLRNYGHSPALNVEMDGEMRIFASGLAINFQALNRQNVICDRLRTRPIGNSGNGFTLIPNEPAIDLRIYFSVSKEEIDNGTLHLVNMRRIPLTFLIGCVRYVFYADSSQHETGFIYEVSQSNGPLRTDQGNIPHDQIVLMSEIFGSGRTN